MRFLSLLLLLLLSFGCASTQKASQIENHNAKLFSVNNGISNVYIYRPDQLMGRAAETQVFINGKLLGLLQPANFMLVSVPPAEYSISFTDGLMYLSPTTINVKAQEKESAFVKLTYGWGSKRIVDQVSDSTGKNDIMELDLVEINRNY